MKLVIEQNNGTNVNNDIGETSSSNQMHIIEGTIFEINNSYFSNEELEKLTSLMKPAMFGLQDKNVYDPTYRKS